MKKKIVNPARVPRDRQAPLLGTGTWGNQQIPKRVLTIVHLRQ